MLALDDGRLEPELRRADRGHIAAGPGPDDNHVEFHSVCVAALAASWAFRPRARALNVRELTRSSRSMMSLRLSLGMPWVIKTMRVRWSSSGQRSSQVIVCKRCCAPWITAGRPGSSTMLTSPFDPQKPRPEVLRNPVQQEPRFLAREGGLAGEHESLNSLVFEMGTVRVPRVIVFALVTIVAASITVVGGVLMRGNIQPRTWISS